MTVEESSFTFQRSGQSCLVDLKNDHYGIEFWRRFATYRYEPDTQALIASFCSHDSLFFDIGAAYGSMSLLAAMQGSRVISYEPNPEIFEGLARNILLNENLMHLVEIRNVAVSSKGGSLDAFGIDDREILSPIVFTVWNKPQSVNVVSLSEEIISTAERYPNTTLVIKMDVEGAEWRILQNEDTLRIMLDYGVLLILALHPGLHRPVRQGNSLLAKVRLRWWNIRNLVESIILFRNLRPYCNVFRTNLSKVRRATAFSFLVLGGNHEFVLDFQKREEI